MAMSRRANDTVTPPLDSELGFAAPHDVPVPYMQRTRTYYQTLGYDPYRWAQYVEVPFAPLRKPLRESRVALITTAAPYQPDKGDQGPGAPYNSAAKFYRVYSLPVEPEPDLRISHVGIDRAHTTAEDSRSWLPLAQLKRLAAEGRIGSVAPRIHGAPTNRSHRVTLGQDCPEMLARLREDRADVAVLLANCPVCHQTISLTARHLEVNGIPTVIMGCAKDIVEHVGVPRFLFSDFPLGNPAGRPNDPASQAATLEMALDLLQGATGPRTTRQSPIRWSDDPDWKLDYSNVERIPPDELERRRAEFQRQKEIARERRVEDGVAQPARTA
jgi:hypothetical protein